MVECCRELIGAGSLLTPGPDKAARATTLGTSEESVSVFIFNPFLNHFYRPTHPTVPTLSLCFPMSPYASLYNLYDLNVFPYNVDTHTLFPLSLLMSQTRKLITQIRQVCDEIRDMKLYSPSRKNLSGLKACLLWVH